jgi:hypothetical protein
MTDGVDIRKPSAIEHALGEDRDIGFVPASPKAVRYGKPSMNAA